MDIVDKADNVHKVPDSKRYSTRRRPNCKVGMSCVMVIIYMQHYSGHRGDRFYFYPHCRVLCCDSFHVYSVAIPVVVSILCSTYDLAYWAHNVLHSYHMYGFCSSLTEGFRFLSESC